MFIDTRTFRFFNFVYILFITATYLSLFKDLLIFIITIFIILNAKSISIYILKV